MRRVHTTTSPPLFHTAREESRNRRHRASLTRAILGSTGTSSIRTGGGGQILENFQGRGGDLFRWPGISELFDTDWASDRGRVEDRNASCSGRRRSHRRSPGEVTSSGNPKLGDGRFGQPATYARTRCSLTTRQR
jgi:hypothetical protein